MRNVDFAESEMLQDMLELAFEAGNHYTSTDDKKMLRIAQRDDGSYYAGRTEPRSDYGDRTVAFISDHKSDPVSVAGEVKKVLIEEFLKSE